MFYFNNKFSQTLPAWFANWWTTFGPIPEILPKEAHQGFQMYQDKFKIPSSHPMNKFPHLYFFFQQFSLAWIVQWEYAHQNPTIISLARKFKVKWWDQFKIDRVTPGAIDKYFHQHPALVSSTTPQFLLQKSKNLSKLAAASSKEELKKQLMEALESLSEHDQASSKESNSPAESFSSVNLGDDNEDDCYGILPPIKHIPPNNQKKKGKTKVKK